MTVQETFFSLHVVEMDRAVAFYTHAFGATVELTSPGWTSLRIAGVRVGLALVPSHEPARTGLHFVVTDLAMTSGAVVHAGGSVGEVAEVAPEVFVAAATDTEGNTFALALWAVD